MLNYRQLHYFWVVAKTGSIVRACEQLNLTPQTISGQISLFEQTYNIKLFRRVGRQLELTEAGRQTLPYAEHMFQLGGELELMLRAQPNEQQTLRSEEHTSELQSLMRISYAVFCLIKQKRTTRPKTSPTHTDPTSYPRHTRTINYPT